MQEGQNYSFGRAGMTITGRYSQFSLFRQVVFLQAIVAAATHPSLRRRRSYNHSPRTWSVADFSSKATSVLRSSFVRLIPILFCHVQHFCDKARMSTRSIVFFVYM